MSREDDARSGVRRGELAGPLPPRPCGFPAFRASFPLVMVTAHKDRREQGVQTRSSGLGTWASLAERWLVLCYAALRALQYSWASLVAQLVKHPPAMWETWVQSLG